MPVRPRCATVLVLHNMEGPPVRNLRPVVLLHILLGARAHGALDQAGLMKAIALAIICTAFIAAGTALVIAGHPEWVMVPIIGFLVTI